MACKAKNPLELKNLIENQKAIFDIKPNQKAEDTVSNLSYTTENFIKREGQYSTIENNAKVKTTITTRIGEWYNRRYPQVKSNEREKFLNQTAEVGNIIHETNEFIIIDILTQLNGLDVNQSLTALASLNINDKEGLKKIREKYGYDLNPQVYDNLISGLKTILNSIYRRQREINRKTGKNENVTILPEQIIIDSQSGIGGTADLIAIFSNNDAAVYDFKTKIPNSNKKNPDGSIKANAELINAGDKERYSMQVTNIAKILKQRYGVRNVVLGRIIPIRINMKPWDKATGLYPKNIVNVAIGSEQDSKLDQITLLPEKTGFEDLDKFLVSIEKRIRSLKEKAKDNKDRRGEYINTVRELEASRDQILHNHNFNKLLDYVKKLNEKITDDYVNSLSFADLRDVISELKVLQLLSESTFEYRKSLKNRGINLDQIQMFEANVGSLISVTTDKIAYLEDILYKDKIADLIKELTGYNILDEEGNIQSFESEGYLGKYFNRLSEFNNPLFQTLRSKLDNIQYDIREKVNKVVSEVQEKEDAIYLWMKKNNKEQKWLIDTLIDKQTDNLVQKRSKEFSEELRSIKKEGKLDKILEYYEPNEYYNDWYEKTKSTIVNKESLEKFEQSFNLSLEKNGKPKYPNAWLQQLSAGRLKVKPSIDNKHISKEYAYIHSIPELANYYDMFIKYNREFRDKLGVEYFNLPDNFVPNIRKQAIDRIVEHGPLKGIKESIDDFIKDMEVRQDDMFFGDIEDGRLTRKIPRFFINPFRDSNDNLMIGEKSYDLGKSLILFSKMAYNYELMSKQESEILGLREFLSEKAEEFIRRGGKNIEDLVGNKLSINIGNTDLKDIFNAYVDMYLYGIHLEPTLGDKSGKWEKRIMLAKQYFTMKSLGLNFIAASGSLLAAKTAASIEGFKGVIYSKDQYKEALTDAYKNRDKFLALNAFFDPMATRYENFSITKENKLGEKQVGKPSDRNFIKKYVTTRTLLRPFSYGDETIDEVITVSMSKNFYVDENGNLKRFRTEEEKTKFANRSIWNLFSYNNEDAKLDIEPEKLKNVIISFRRAIQEGQSKIKGTIPEEDKAYWQSQILGQVVMHFKSWMPGLIKERFGDLRYNTNIQSVDIGRYIAAGYEFKNVEQYAAVDFMTKIVVPKLGEFAKRLLLFSNNSFNDKERKLEAFNEWLEKNPHFEDKISFEEFLELQQKQVHAMVVELRIILAFAAIMMALGGDWDDDGEADYKKYYMAKVMMAILYKTNQELTFVYNPTEFAGMIKNPIPMIGLATSATKTIGNTFDETRDVLFGENNKQDKTPLGYESHKWIPGAYGISKLFGLFDQEPEALYKR